MRAPGWLIVGRHFRDLCIAGFKPSTFQSTSQCFEEAPRTRNTSVPTRVVRQPLSPRLTWFCELMAREQLERILFTYGSHSYPRRKGRGNEESQAKTALTGRGWPNVSVTRSHPIKYKWSDRILGLGIMVLVTERPSWQLTLKCWMSQWIHQGSLVAEVGRGKYVTLCRRTCGIYI